MRSLIQITLILLLLSCAPYLRAELLDINTATVEQLDETMVGVGKTKAQAIVEDREKNGRFKSVDDLIRVKGIGPATVEKNRNKIVAGSETTVSTPQAQPVASPASPGGEPAKSTK